MDAAVKPALRMAPGCTVASPDAWMALVLHERGLIRQARASMVGKTIDSWGSCSVAKIGIAEGGRVCAVIGRNPSVALQRLAFALVETRYTWRSGTWAAYLESVRLLLRSSRD